MPEEDAVTGRRRSRGRQMQSSIRQSFSAPTSPIIRSRTPADFSPRTVFANGARHMPDRLQVQAMLSERVDHAAHAAAQAARDMIRVPLACAGIGVACLSAPVLTLFLAPLILLLTPIFLSFGFGLTLFGLGRAGLIVTLGGDAPSAPPSAPGDALEGTPATPQIGTRTHPRTGSGSGTVASSGTGDGGANRNVHGFASPALASTEAPTATELAGGAACDGVLVRHGSLTELNQLATKRGGHLVKQVSALVCRSVVKATREVSGEVEQNLSALQSELRSWAGKNPNLKPYCQGQIGWMLRAEARQLEARRTEALQIDLAEEGAATSPPRTPVGSPTSERSRRASSPTIAWSPRQRPELDLSAAFTELLESMPPQSVPLTRETLASVPLPEGTHWGGLSFLLVPGLLTKWYPLYMKQLRSDLKRLGLHASFSRVDTDQPVRINAARLRHEILELALSGRRIVLLGHSKGAVDAAAALSLFPELIDSVAGLVSLQGPHGGSAIAHDLSNTHVQRDFILGALERLLRGCRHAVLDLSFEARQDFLRQHEYPLHRVPTLCVASCDRRSSISMLTPLIEYVAIRYGEMSDGLVCQGDAIIPNCVRVIIDDMDHCGPAWGSFPATDRYDPTRLWLACVSLTLRSGAARERPPPPMHYDAIGGSAARPHFGGSAS
jgi:triacylglycerol lipase